MDRSEGRQGAGGRGAGQDSDRLLSLGREPARLPPVEFYDPDKRNSVLRFAGAGPIFPCVGDQRPSLGLLRQEKHHEPDTMGTIA
jgi:hypothetical protein